MPTLTKVTTSRFGDLEVPEDALYRLLRPLAGFPATRTLTKVALPNQRPFTWLQSLEEGDVAFAAAPAAWLRPDYAVRLAEWDREAWGALGEAEVYALISFPKEPCANLAVPVLLDPVRRVALQVLNQAGSWGLTEPLFPGVVPQGA